MSPDDVDAEPPPQPDKTRSKAATAAVFLARPEPSTTCTSYSTLLTGLPQFVGRFGSAGSVSAGQGLEWFAGTRFRVGTRLVACRSTGLGLAGWVVSMHLRETRRTNRDGSVVSYLQLAHNERHLETGSPVAKVIHNFGRAENVDRTALARLVSSISRFLTPEQATAAAAGAEVEIVDSRPLGGAWTLDRVWERLGIGAAVRRVAASRRLDGEAVERVVFALVAQRALKPGSKLAATDWVAKRVAIEGLAGFTDDQAYRAMDFLLEALNEIAGEIFGSVAHLLNLDLDIVFVDTTSTYFELDVPDELADLQDSVDDDGITRPLEQGKRSFGHSKDNRGDLPQVVIAMAVTRDGVPVRCWTFPGNTGDTSIIRTVKDDLAGWNLHRMVWVADRGFASAANRAYLTRGGGHYIHAEKLRNTNSEAAAALARPGRYRTVAGNLRVKEVTVAPGGSGDGDDGARAQRFVVCHNPEQADRDAAVRDQLLAHLEQLMTGSDAWTERRRNEFVGSLKSKPGLRRHLRRTSSGRGCPEFRGTSVAAR